MQNNKKIGLALSGGGYRAAGFHLGTLKKLNELNLLDKVDVLSTISGGSITGAYYCLNNSNYQAFENYMVTALTTKSVIGYVLRSGIFLRGLALILVFIALSVYISFTPYAYLSILPIAALIYILVSKQFKIFPLSVIIEKAYNAFFFKQATLSNLCDHPEMAIGSTNLETGRHFTFSKRKMEDSTYAYRPEPIYFLPGNFPVARAVMASSCVPFAFSPIPIAQEFFADPKQFTEVTPRLIDGGVYDNQGIHKITQKNSSYACDVILVSDAGSNFPFQGLYNNTITLLMRTVDIFMRRIKDFQMIQQVYENAAGHEIAYLSLGWNLDACISGFIDNLKKGQISASVIVGHQIPEAWVKAPETYRTQLIALLREQTNFTEVYSHNLDPLSLKAIWSIGTNLTCLSKKLVDDMIIHAANLTEIQVRLYCPSLFKEQV